jgi:hypothetical protein
LLGAEKGIIIRTDHKSIRDFTKTQLLSAKHARWALVLEEFRGLYKIEWIPGKSNVVADALSRDPKFNLSAKELLNRREATIIPPDVLPREAMDNLSVGSTETEIAVDSDIEKDEEHLDQEKTEETTSKREHQTELLAEEARRSVLRVRHDDKLSGGHYGVRKTLDLIGRDFWWKGMRKDVE